jgi:hypothetical protein
VPGAVVCRRHGANSSVLRNAERLTVLREFYAALPYLQRWTAELIGEHDHYLAALADGDSPRRCRARRTNGQPCGCWAIRGGFVCRVHGGAAPQVRAKAMARVESAKIYRRIVGRGDADAVSLGVGQVWTGNR